MPATLSAQRFVKKLESYRSPTELEKLRRYFKPGEGGRGEGASGGIVESPNPSRLNNCSPGLNAFGFDGWS